MSEKSSKQGLSRELQYKLVWHKKHRDAAWRKKNYHEKGIEKIQDQCSHPRGIGYSAFGDATVNCAVCDAYLYSVLSTRWGADVGKRMAEEELGIPIEWSK